MMIRIITISLILLILFGWNNLKDPKKVVVPEQPFTLHDNELALLNFDSCSYQISFDTIRSISQFRSLRNSFLDSRKDLTSDLCITFNFKTADTGKAKTVIVTYAGIPAFSGSGILRREKYLILDIRDSAYLYSILGGAHAFNGAATNEVHKYVKEFYLNIPDSANMKDKFINIHFHYDTIGYMERFLSQAVRGYIMAQRELSVKLYGKELQYANNEELIALRNRLPFIFKLTYEPMKTVPSNPVDSLR